MQISVKSVKKVKVLNLEGKLDTQSSPEAEEHLTRLINAGETRILINLENLDYISSSGLRVLLVVAKRLKSAGGELRICSANDFVKEVFEISGFATIFRTLETEAEALKDF